MQARASLAEKLSASAAAIPQGSQTGSRDGPASEDKADAAQMLDEVLAPLLRRDPDELRDRLWHRIGRVLRRTLSTMPVRDASGRGLPPATSHGRSS